MRQLPMDEVRKLHINVLLVLDDVISEIKKNEFNTQFISMFFNRRHKIINGTISIMLLTQKYTLVPSRIRSNSNWTVAFSLNPSDLKLLYEDQLDIPKDQWEELVIDVFGDPLSSSSQVDHKYNFFSVHSERKRYFKNFEELTFEDGLIRNQDNKNEDGDEDEDKIKDSKGEKEGGIKK